MSKYVEYKGLMLQRGSNAYYLFTEMQAAKDTKAKEALRKKLEQSLKETGEKYKAMHGKELEPAWKVGNE